MSKLTDYATVVLAALAERAGRRQTATALAVCTGIALPTVSKVLKSLHRAGLVSSTRGTHGGYLLARPATTISAAAILDALEGPLALTDCAAGEGHCVIERSCRVGRSWQRVNFAIRRSLGDVSLAQLAGLDPAPVRLTALERELGRATGGASRVAPGGRLPGARS